MYIYKYNSTIEPSKLFYRFSSTDPVECILFVMQKEWGYQQYSSFQKMFSEVWEDMKLLISFVK